MSDERHVVVLLHEARTAEVVVPLMILATLSREVNQFRQSRERVVVALHRCLGYAPPLHTSTSLVLQGKLVDSTPHRKARCVKHDLAKSGPFIGVGGMTVVAFLYGYTAIAFPSWLHTLVMPVLWLVLFVVSCAWFTRRPRAVVLLPVVAAVLWFVLLIASGSD